MPKQEGSIQREMDRREKKEAAQEAARAFRENDPMFSPSYYKPKDTVSGKPALATKSVTPEGKSAIGKPFLVSASKVVPALKPSGLTGPGNAFAVASAAKPAAPVKTAMKPSGLKGPGSAFAAASAVKPAPSVKTGVPLAGGAAATANMAAMKNAYTPATPAVAKSKVVSTPVKTAKAAPQAVPMPPQRPAGITPSYPTGNAAMAYGPAREKGSMPFTPFAGSVKVSGGTGFGGGGGGGFGGGYGGGGGGLNPGSNSSKSGTKSGPTAGREPGGSK